MTWVNIAVATVSVYSGMQASKAQDGLSEANRDASVTAQTYENQGLNERIREEQGVVIDNKMEMLKKAMKAKGTLQAQGRNVSGADQQSNEIQNSLGIALTQLNANMASKKRQLVSDKKGTSAKAESRINSVPMGNYNPTGDILNAGLSIYGKKIDADKAKDKSPVLLDFTGYSGANTSFN